MAFQDYCDGTKGNFVFVAVEHKPSLNHCDIGIVDVGSRDSPVTDDKPPQVSVTTANWSKSTDPSIK